MDNTNKITVWFSTDGKLSISFNADDVKEANKLYPEAETLFKKMVALKNELGLVIPSRGGFPPKKEKEWTGNTCPKDKGRLYQATTATGKKMIKCENSKWNPLTKSASGCDYIEWVNDGQDSQKKFEGEVQAAANGEKMATPAQVNLIIKLQGEGRLSELVEVKKLTMAEASSLIKSSINK